MSDDLNQSEGEPVGSDQGGYFGDGESLDAVMSSLVDDSIDEVETVDADDTDSEGYLSKDDLEEKGEPEADESTDLFDIDGEKLTFDQLREGYLKNSDYTKKTQEIGDQRKAMEFERNEIEGVKKELEASYTDLEEKYKALEADFAQKQKWDFFLSNLKNQNPDRFEDLMADFDQTATHYDNPLVNSVLKQVSGKMTQQEQEIAQIKEELMREKFHVKTDRIKQKWGDQLNELGLKVDWDKRVFEASKETGGDVERALMATYGPEIMRLRLSKTKLNTSKQKSKSNVKTPTAGNVKRAGNVPRSTKETSYFDMFSEALKEF